MHRAPVPPLMPPDRTNMDGDPRHVGIEIEFAGLSAAYAANVIQTRFGGSVETVDPQRYLVRDTRLGTFKCELDSRFAHPEAYPRSEDPEADRWLAHLRSLLSSTFADIGSIIIPIEIVTPPVPINRLDEINGIIDDLRIAGAQGTESSVFFAFGLHLNPDAATLDPEWILNVLRAELLLSRWLRAVMDIDMSRQLTGFASSFPAAYAQRILDLEYRPELGDLIDDYIADNPTRDRELDMLPLFAWLDEDRVRHQLPLEKIGRRPTFHYRLPNADLGRETWSISTEWNRWCLIEQLASRSDVLRPMAQDYLATTGTDVFDRWGIRSSDWLMRMLQFDPSQTTAPQT